MENVVGFIEPHMNARGHQLHLLKGRLKPLRPRDNYGLVGTHSSSSTTIYIYSFFFNIKTKIYLIHSAQHKLTCQIHDHNHETRLTLYKINQNKL